ncbi:MAG: EAL domain-containing protein, partial [Cellulomonadaceae bacterium]|nr:EAL domain-containing protein [Cellulomonadaceae bacterium]
IEFAQRTGAQLLVEGIEARDDLHVWTHLGAHTVQGYLTGRPSALPVPTRSAAITPRAVMRVAAARSAG